MKKSFRLTLLSGILFCLVGCDQATKALARQALATEQPIHLLAGAVRLQYAENPGAFLSLGAGLPDEVRFLLGVVLVSVILVLAVAHFLRAESLSRQRLLGLALLVGGGLGNLIDRILHDGVVIDFVSLGLGPLRTGIFNVADVAITTGVVLLWISAFERDRSSPGPEAEPG